MATIKVKLFVEEMETLIKGNGDPVSIFDDGETVVIVSYDKDKGGE